jgi:hypothetical protein
MTCIVDPRNFASKAKLQALLTEREGAVTITDPSIFAPFSLPAKQAIPVGQSLVVTNHPLRTKFAKITRTGNNDWKVS